jgi:hypothetical protein
MRKTSFVPTHAARPRVPILRVVTHRLASLVGARRRVQHLPARDEAEFDLAQRVRMSGEW